MQKLLAAGTGHCVGTTNVEAIRQMVRDMFDFEVGDNIGNLPPQTGIYPDMLAPIMRNRPGLHRELVKVRWGSGGAAATVRPGRSGDCA